MQVLVWIGIALCLSQSAMFSGLNLALFSIGRLRLEVEASKKHPGALKAHALRKDSNFALTTILWGNVAANVLLALLSNSVLVGLMAFLFSTVVITFMGEIIPQAYFSRHALRMVSLLSPMLRFYQIILYPVAKPSAILLDAWLGREGILYFSEQDFRKVIQRHIESDEADIDLVEGIGALNFLDLDDLMVAEEGEPLHPESIISIPFVEGRPAFPAFEPSAQDPFLLKIQSSGKKWVVLTDTTEEPRLVMDANGFLRATFFKNVPVDPMVYCHAPVVVKDAAFPLGETLRHFKVHKERPGDDVIDQDIILVWWKTQKRIITGADILGRLLRGIVMKESASAPRQAPLHADQPRHSTYTR